MEIAILNESKATVNNELEIILKSRLLTFDGYWQLSDDVLASVHDSPGLTLTYDYLVNVRDSNNLVYPDDLEMLLGVIESVTQNQPITFTIRLISPAGEIKLLHANGTFIDTSQPKPAFANWDNYTNELDLNLKTFEYAETVSSIGCWRWNLDTNSIYTSFNFNRICGLHEEYILTDWEAFLDCIYPEDRNRVWNRFKQAHQFFKSFQAKFRIITSDGSTRYITLKGKPFKSRTQTNYLLGTIQDFTEYEHFTQTISSQRSELAYANELLQSQNQQLQESKALLESVIQSDIVALSVFKPVRNEHGDVEDFVWIMANKMMKAIAQGQNVVGKRYTDIFPAVKEDGTLALLTNVMNTGERAIHEHYYEDKNIRGWFHSVYVKMHDVVIVGAEDITLQKNAERELNESKNKLEAAFNVSTTALSIVRTVRDNSGTITDFVFEWLNKAAGKMFGDVTGQHSFLNVLPEENRSALFDLFAHVVDNNEPLDTEMLYFRTHEYRWIRWKALKVDHGLFVSAEDITVQKAAQRELATLIENTPDIITRWNRDLKLVFANAAFEERMGIPNAALYGKNNVEMGQPVYIAEPWMHKLKKVFDSGQPDTHYNTVRAPHGVSYLFSRIVPEKNAKGEVETVLAIARDITELKKSEQELLKNFQILQQTEAVAGIGSWEFIPSGNLFTWSAGMYTIFGIPKDTEVSPEIYQRFVVPDDNVVAEKIIGYLRHDPQPFEEIMRIRIDGKLKTIKIRATVIYDENKLPWKILGVDFDITAITESVRLKELNTTLKEVDRAKTKFFSNISHEFRTPLTLLLAPLEDILRNNSLQPHDRQRTEMVYRNGIRLQKLVNTLLDFSRIEAGRQEAFFQPTDIVSYTVDLASNFRSVIEKAGLKFNVKSKKIKDPVYVNREMWEKIVLNLISNAFKFTHQGSIDVEVRSLLKYIQLHVRDTGIGIATNNLSKIFDRFTRIEGARARTYEGSGIGLALVKELVALHSGTIRVKSTEGIGTEFIITIPKGKSHLPYQQIFENAGQLHAGARASAYIQEAASWLPDEKLKSQALSSSDILLTQENQDSRPVILLADDNADMREYLAHLLSSHYKVISVENGKRALDRIHSGIHIDLILADVMMPELDGHHLVDILKRDANYRAIPVVLLSARSGEDARIEGFSFGADDYLAKPFSSRELTALVHARIEIARTRYRAEQELSNKNLELEHRVLERTRQLEESRSLIEKQNLHLQNILDAIPQMVWVRESDGNVKYINNRWYSYTGLSVEQCKIIASRQCDIFHADQQAEIEQKWQASNNNPKYYRGKILIRDKHGEYRWHLDIMEPIVNDAGEVEMWVGSFTDIHEQFLSAQQLKTTNDLLEAILNSSTNAISVLDSHRDAEGHVRDFTWKYFNTKAQQFANQKDLRGNTISAELPQAQASVLLQKFLDVVHTGITTEFEYEAYANGVKYWYQTIAVKLGDGLVVTQQDITDKVRSRQHLVLLNESLKQKNYALKAMNDELANFAFIASHDLREPLRKIQLFTRELVEKEATVVSARGKAHAQRILDAVLRMNALIDDVFAFSRASSTATATRVDVAIQEQLQQALTDLHDVIEASHAVIEYTDLPVLRSNPIQIAQLLQHLISNAIKFQPPHAIPYVRITGFELAGRAIESPLADCNADYICIEVADNGIGFEEKYIERIFHMFQKLHVKSEFPGTGMGLAICKKIMQNHGGFIIAKSVVNEGSVFSCYFPKNGDHAFSDNR